VDHLKPHQVAVVVEATEDVEAQDLVVEAKEDITLINVLQTDKLTPAVVEAVEVDNVQFQEEKLEAVEK
jgi:hypothetical protein